MDATHFGRPPAPAADRATKTAERSTFRAAEDMGEDALRSVYLRRLERLLSLRQAHYQDLNEKGLRLLDRSIFAAYCDCRSAGAEGEARDSLRRMPILEGGGAGSLDPAHGHQQVGSKDRPYV